MDPSPPFFLYDGDCGFCAKWARWLARQVPEPIELVPFQSVDDLGRLGLTGHDVRTASWWIDEHGDAHRGNSSFAHVLQRSTGARRLAGLVLELPITKQLAAVAYRLIARNRHRLPAPG